MPTMLEQNFLKAYIKAPPDVIRTSLASSVRAVDFESKELGEIWQVISEIGTRNVPDIRSRLAHRQKDHLIPYLEQALEVEDTGESLHVLALNLIDTAQKRLMQTLPLSISAIVNNTKMNDQGKYVAMQQIIQQVAPRTIRPTAVDLHQAVTNAFNVVHRSQMPNAGGYLPMPFRGLWKYGGNCARCTRGQVITVVAGDGQGKSRIVNTMAFHWMKDGYNGIVLSPELSVGRAAWGLMSFATGVPVSAFSDDQEYSRRLNLGEDTSHLRPLNSEQLKLVNEFYTNREKNYSGKITWIDSATSIQVLETEIAKQIEVLAVEGKELHYVVVDYIQMMKTDNDMGRTEAERVSAVNQRLSELTARYNLVMLIVSQSTKAAQRERAIRRADAQNYRTDTSKLVLVWERDYDANGNYENSGTLRVEKNNDGSFGSIKLYLEFNRGCVVEEPPTRFSF